MDDWMNHRDALYERAVHRGRALQWRRRIVASAAVAAVVALGVGILATRPDGDHRVRVEGPVATSTTVPEPVGVLAGAWERHGVDLHITPDGDATMNWRTYRVCGQDAPPCDTWVGNVITDGGHGTFALHATGPQTAAGTVLTTSDAATLPLGPISASLDEKNDLLFLVPFPGSSAPFCGPRANDPRCGA